MSIEAPEAYILAEQMNRELLGKQVISLHMQNCQKLQKIGCVNRDASVFNSLIDKKVTQVTSRGLTILVKFEDGMNFLLGPEYGGRILYHEISSGAPAKFHFKLDLNSGSAFTVTLTGLGCIQAFREDELQNSYLYRRDFSDVPSPLSKVEFSLERFSKGLAERNSNIKSAIVGKDALLVGLSNSSFQDILFRAKIHPKRKGASLDDQEKEALYNSVNFVVEHRIQLGGKNQFVDFYGKPGGYMPAMGPNMKEKSCKVCGSTVQVLSLGGGQVYFCPKCQV